METKFKSIKTKSALILAVVLVALIAVSVVTYAQNNSFWKSLGVTQKTMQEKEDTGTTILTINNYKVSQKTFDEYKESLNLAKNDNEKLTDKQVADKLIERELLYQEAQKQGLSLNEEEFKKTMDNVKSGIKNDTEAYNQLKDYLTGRGMTEEEYWKIAEPIYQKAFLIGQYKKSLKEEFKKSDESLPKLSQSEFNSKFDDLYKNKIKDIKQKAMVKENLDSN